MDVAASLGGSDTNIPRMRMAMRIPMPIAILLGQFRVFVGLLSLSSPAKRWSRTGSALHLHPRRKPGRSSSLNSEYLKRRPSFTEHWSQVLPSFALRQMNSVTPTAICCFLFLRAKARKDAPPELSGWQCTHLPELARGGAESSNLSRLVNFFFPGTSEISA